MIDFYVYNEIGNEYELDKEMLNKELMINTVCPKIEEPNDLITNIYKHCFREAYYYSWLYSKKTNQFYNDISDYDKEDKYEEAIMNHCIVAALYTVQYLKYKDVVISAPQLGSRARGNGHNWVNNLSETHIENNELTFEKSKDGSLTDKDTNEKINDVLKEINKLQESELDYIERTLDIRLNYDNNKVLKNTKVSFFLCNLSYKILINFNKFNIFGSFNYIHSTSRGNKRNKSIKKFINDYMDYDDKIYFRKEDEDKNKKAEVRYYETTEIDKILFYYKKERLLHSDFIKYCFSKKSEINGLVFAENTNEDILNLCMMLPNVYSRNIFAEFFKELSYNEDGYDKAVDYLNDLLYITFPIFEKTFFISLHEYCKANHQGKEPLDLMNEYLTDYVITEIFNKDKKKYIKKSLKRSEILINYTTEKKGSLMSNERCSRIFNLLEFAFNIENINRTNIRNNYKHPKVNIPKFDKFFNNKSELNYLKEAIYRDYHFYLNLYDDYNATYAYKNNISQQMIDEILQEYRKYFDRISKESEDNYNKLFRKKFDQSYFNTGYPHK